MSFLTGNLAPDGSVIKATAIDPAVLMMNGKYQHTGTARVFFRREEGNRGGQKAGGY